MMRPLMLLTLLASAGFAQSRVPPPVTSASFVAPLFQVGDGAGPVQIGVALNHAATAPVTVTYRTSDGSAKAGVDYTAREGELVFAPGQVLASFTVNVSATGTAASRTVNLQLTRAAGAAVLGPDELAVMNIRGVPARAGAHLLSPAPGSRLPGNQAQFYWSGPLHTAYWLTVGTKPGGNDLFNRHLRSFRVATVPNLPTDGRTVYVQLWTQAGDGWNLFATALESAGTAVVREPEGPVPPAPLPEVERQTVRPAALTGRRVQPGWLINANLVSPTPGTRLPAGAVTFTWGAVPWTTGYTLEVLSGTTVLATQDVGLATQATVSGLPADGRQLTVRLTTRFVGTSMQSQATYTAATSTVSSAVQHNLAQINYYRGLKGSPALVLDTKLSAFAQAGSEQLAIDHLPHQHFINASNAGTLWTTGGFSGSAAENQGDPNGWTQLSSDPNQNTILQINAIMLAMYNEGPGGGHYENMIAPRFTKVGIGLVTVSGKLYLTNDFSQ